MANGLFSMPTPAEVRANARRELENRAFGLAQLPVGRGGVALAGQAGGLFAQGVNQATGMVSPEEGRAIRFQQVQQTVTKMYQDKDLTDPIVQMDMMADSANLLQKSGFAREAAQALNMATQIRNSLPKPSTSDVFSKVDPEKFTQESVRKFQKSGKYGDLVPRETEKSRKASSGQRAIDKEFAKVFVEWKTGAAADVEKNINQLQSAADLLESNRDDLTGPVLGTMPDIVKKFSYPQSIATRDQVEEVVQRNLRLVLGAQFTQREGERLIARAYNENLDEKENAKRVSNLITAIKGAAKAKQEAVDYYDKHGTLEGFEGGGLTQAGLEAVFWDNLKGEDGETDPLQGLSGIDREAMQWALDNPDTPQAKAIRERLGR